jgi:zinc transport system permease protein
MIEALEYPFFVRALIAGLLASVACGVVGTYIVVKRIASISGSLSHAAFGGVGLGYLAGFDPIIGAAAFSLASSAGLGFAYRRFGSNLDTLLAMIWSVGMALGMVFIALAPGSAPDLMSYLFGSILFAPPDFLVVAGLLDVIIIATAALMFKEFQSVSFDEEFAKIMGIPVGLVLHVLLALISLAVVVLIRVVGVIMVIALLTFPAAIARHWSQSLARMMAYATLICAGCTTFGLFFSYWLSSISTVEIPTGPLIILVAAGFYLVSMVARKSIGHSK